MKNLFLTLAITFLSIVSLFAQTHTRSYSKNNSSYVKPYQGSTSTSNYYNSSPKYSNIGTSSSKTKTYTNNTLVTTTPSVSQTQTKGYYKNNGTYVQSYQKSVRNNTNTDNYSTIGNTNPNTGSSGYRASDYSSKANNYGNGKTIHKGSQGGQYYINSNSNKVYVPKRSF